MQIEISASGTPSQVNADVATQTKAAAASDPEAWPTLVSARDYIGKMMSAIDPNDTVTVKASLTIQFAITPSSPSVGAPVAEPEEPDGN